MGNLATGFRGETTWQSPSMQTLSNPNGVEWHYACDQIGRLQKVNPDCAADAAYTYDSVGNLQSKRHAECLLTRIERDAHKSDSYESYDTACR